MLRLILDIKICIASFDEDVWINMVLYDEEFKQYACAHAGIKQFIDNHHKVIDGNTYLFDKLHSIYDKPAEIHYNGYHIWYYQGIRHRENDLPAIICSGSKEWFYAGFRHRENDLPAIMYDNGCHSWWYKDELHRNNDLPLVISS